MLYRRETISPVPAQDCNRPTDGEGQSKCIVWYMCYSISTEVHSAVFGVYNCVEIEAGPQLHTVLYGPQASSKFRRSPSLLSTFFSRSLI